MDQIKDNIEDLDRVEAIEKMKELVNHNSMCHFITALTEIPLDTRPMNVLKVCDQGNFWFLSGRNSRKNEAITVDNRVQLLFANTSDSEYLTVYGTASISSYKDKIEELWTPLAKVWFTEGKDDPRITVIKVTPEEAFYWDTKNGKAVSLIKMLASVVAGKTMDGGVEGELLLK